MSKIKILSPQEICKIAAGEVVERPANIVKELIENSLDAGADHIDIYISKAGKEAIRVVDNGCGMSAQDAKLCFAHHATSKISTVGDLESLVSFGFRGEALSSISAVSKITLITCEKNTACGTKVTLQAGHFLAQEDTASPVGTDILIADLFFNVPARQKFLKKEETEWRQIVQLFQAFVLDYTGVNFKLYHEGRLVYNCPAVQQLTDRIVQLFDAPVASSMLALEQTSHKELKISGIISNHQVFRYNRAQIFCFVNRRLVKNYGLVKSLLKGYANVLPNGRYPIAVLLLELPNQQVDINVHPRKEEVSFLHPKRIENLLLETVKKSLEKVISSQIATPKTFNINQQDQASWASPFQSSRLAKFDFDQAPEPIHDQVKKLNYNRFENIISEVLKPQSQLVQVNFVERDYEIIGQFKKTYILVSNTSGLVLVDQHAAHERVLYERFKKRFHDVVTVSLMFPVILTLKLDDLNTIKPYLHILKQHGIGADIFGEDQIVISSTPTYLKQTKLDDLIYQVIAWIHEHQEMEPEIFFKQINEQLHAQMACKAAVKAGDILTSSQMYELLDDLEKSDNRLTCPHGRPTMWSFTLDEIEKKFKRKL